MITQYNYYLNTDRKCLCKPGTIIPVTSKNDLPELDFGDEPEFILTFPNDVLVAGSWVVLAIDNDYDFYSKNSSDELTMCFAKTEVTSEDVQNKSIVIKITTRTQKFLDKINGNSGSLKLFLGVYIKYTPELKSSGEYITLARSNAYANGIVADYGATSLVLPSIYYYTKEEINEIYEHIHFSAEQAENNARTAISSAESASRSETAAEAAKDIAQQAEASARETLASSESARQEINEKIDIVRQLADSAGGSAESARSYSNLASESESNSRTYANAANQYKNYAKESSDIAVASANSAASSADLAVSAKNSAESASSNAESYKNIAETYMDSAESYSQSANSSKISAGDSAAIAVEKANLAAVSSNSAEEYKNLAKGYSEDARSSKDAALISETNARNHDSSSQESANRASSSESNARNYATAASQSEVSAKASEIKSKTSETNAKNSENSASNSAEQAGNSATAAQNSAAIASSASSTAESHANDASLSKNSATASAESAARSATEAESASLNAATDVSNRFQQDLEDLNNAVAAARSSADNASQAESTIAGYLDQMTAAAQSAQESKDSALISAAKAQQSENKSKTSEINAKNSEDSARDSKDLAVSSAQSASQSKLDAGNYAEQALTAKQQAENIASTTASDISQLIQQDIGLINQAVEIAQEAAIDSAASAIEANNHAESASQNAQTTSGYVVEVREIKQSVEGAVSQANAAKEAAQQAAASTGTSIEQCTQLKNQTQAIYESVLATVATYDIGPAYSYGLVQNGSIISFTWQDPVDNNIVKWSKTRLIMKQGGFPENETDGTVLTDSTVRNQYQSTPFDYDMGVISDGYFALFTQSTGGSWNTGDESPRFTTDDLTWATLAMMSRTGALLQYPGMQIGAVVDIQVNSIYPKLRYKLAHIDYSGDFPEISSYMYDNTRIHNSIWIPAYLPCLGDSNTYVASQFDAPELAYARTWDTVFITSKAYFIYQDDAYIRINSGTDYTDGDSIQDWETTNSKNVYTQNDNNRKNYGSNSWKESNMRQWLNISGENWFQQQSEYDVKSSNSHFNSGWMTGFDQGFLNLVSQVNVKTARNTVSAITGGGGGGFDMTVDKFWLPSIKEVFNNNNNNLTEGAQFAYFRDVATTNAQRIQYDEGGTARYCWLRSPNTGNTNNVYYINTSGSSNNDSAHNTYGFLPSFCL